MVLSLRSFTPSKYKSTPQSPPPDPSPVVVVTVSVEGSGISAAGAPITAVMLAVTVVSHAVSASTVWATVTFIVVSSVAPASICPAIWPIVEVKPLQSSPGSLLACKLTVTGSLPVLVTLTVYSPESPGLTSKEFGETFRLILGAAETGVAINGRSDTNIRLTKKNAARLARDTLSLRLSMISGERLSIKSLSFIVLKNHREKQVIKK